MGILTRKVCSRKVSRRNKDVTKKWTKSLEFRSECKHLQQVTHICEPLNKNLIVQKDFLLS